MGMACRAMSFTIVGRAIPSGRAVFYALPFTFLILSLTAPSRAQSNIVYRYDGLGRLVEVVDPSGQSAIYTYDEVGNIISIARQTAAQLSILSFVPNSGAASTVVRIYGSGFNGSPNFNRVQFNGVDANVQSASLTEIVTSVPPGATTGPITVTTASGSTVSTKAFVVGSGPPNISGFTPSIASPGTAVSIAGSNFNTTAAGDTVRFNSTGSQVTAATAVSINTSVPPGATSGRISISTVGGKATSSSDFFVPPDPYKPSDVGFTGRMSVGNTSTLTLGSATSIGLMLFEGKTGQRISLQVSNSTFGTCGLTVTMLSPNGLNLGSNGSCGNLVDTPNLTMDGTYTILAEPFNGATGDAALTLYDITSSVVPNIPTDGSPVTVNISAPGQQVELTFNGSAGQRIGLTLTNGTIPVTCLNVSLINPDGTALNSTLQCIVGDSGAFIGPQTLSATGAYRIVIAPIDASTGTITLALYSIPPDITGFIAPGGDAVTVNIATPGQGASLTFNGLAGQRVSLLANGTVSACAVNISIVNPDGTTLTSAGTVCLPGLIGAQTLPASGTYTILLTLSGASVGNIVVNLYSVVDVLGPIMIGGSPVVVNLAIPGEKGQLTFSGSAGAPVSVHITDNTFGCFLVTVGILNTDGTTLSSQSFCDVNFDAPGQTLPATGTYTLFVQPYQATTGSMTVSLVSP